MNIGDLLDRLAERIEAMRVSRLLRVAVDGPDAAGKTTLADALAGVLRARGRDVIRMSIDDFLRPRAQRYRRGNDSPDGYYEDAFDLDATRRALFDQSSAGTDGGVLLFDGVFLLRPELLDAWDLRVYVSIDPEEVLRRALKRDVALFGSQDEVRRRYRARYLPAQRHYLAAVRPLELADVVIDNDDPDNPTLRG